MDLPSSSASNSKTSILDMNDDCMLHVFEYLDLKGLVTVTDVCSRFRQNARDQFAHPKLKNYYDIVYQFDSDRKPEFPLKTSRLMRNFGDHIKHISVNVIDLDIHRYLRIFHVHYRLGEVLNRFCQESRTNTFDATFTANCKPSAN